jgi:Domain of unknown function (DUF5916)/Carbohydrate family 9 binding domain-like
MRFFLLSVCVNLSAFLVPLLAQQSDNFPPPAVAPRLTAVEATEKMSTDGRLDEAVWRTAPVIQDFFRMEPRQGGPVRYSTRVQVAFDRKNLYFGVFCYDSLGKKGVRMQDYRRDFEFGENDIFYLQLDPQNLRRYCMSFQTTPMGTQRDLQVFDDSFRDNDWDALWRVRTSVVDSGYYAEFAIPFKTLRYERPADTDTVHWGVTFARLARREYELSVYPPVPQTFSPYRMSYSAQLYGLKLPPPSANVRIQPYTLYQYDRNRNAQSEITVRDNLKAGGEVKWAVNSHAVLDLTFNTDFAQADVDRAVNNLTRFNLFFPERRQFFLENSGVYAGADIDGVKPFFSRSIGLANSQFNADPVPIDAGARYTDRNQKRTIAGLYVHQRATDFQGGANFGVLRYARNYRKQDNVGVMVTHRYDEANTERGFSDNHNTTLTLDGFNRPNEDWTSNYLISVSRDQASGQVGTAGSVFVGYTPNQLYMGWVSKWVTRNYQPGMGFVFGNDVVHHNPGGYYIWRPKGWLGKYIRRWDPGIFVNYYHNASDGRLQQADIYIFPIYTIFNDNSRVEYALFPTWQNVPVSFPILNREVPVGNYQYLVQEVAYRSDQSKKLAVRINYSWGGFYNGRLRKVIGQLRIAPAPKLALTLDYERNMPRYFGPLKETFTVNLYAAGLRVAYNPRLQASVFYQYNDLDRRGRWNIRGSWEFQPLSFLFVVFNESNFVDTSVRNQSLISKVSYLRQF